LPLQTATLPLHQSVRTFPPQTLNGNSLSNPG
jgi:hypothetical protein